MTALSAKPQVKQALAAWFKARGWKPFKFQREVWQAIAEGRSGLLHATTGAGKTYAVWLGALMSFVALAHTGRAQAAMKTIAKQKDARPAPLTVLWIMPMRRLKAPTVAHFV
jgi:ATP-dependent helicase Lhr and Lhr-like helicase